MVNIQKLKAKFVENDLTQADVAQLLGLSPRTLQNRLKKGVFNNVEIKILTKELKINNPIEIFFDNNLSY